MIAMTRTRVVIGDRRRVGGSCFRGFVVAGRHVAQDGLQTRPGLSADAAAQDEAEAGEKDAEPAGDEQSGGYPIKVELAPGRELLVGRYPPWQGQQGRYADTQERPAELTGVWSRVSQCPHALVDPLPVGVPEREPFLRAARVADLAEVLRLVRA
jgi:hypothetical protein